MSTYDPFQIGLAVGAIIGLVAWLAVASLRHARGTIHPEQVTERPAGHAPTPPTGARGEMVVLLPHQRAEDGRRAALDAEIEQHNTAQRAAYAALPLLDLHRSCPKCGCATISATHRPERISAVGLVLCTPHQTVYPIDPEHVKRECPTCHHTWNERPLDAADAPTPTAPRP